jgi:DNA-binding transcriptional LysR family regulator
MTPPPAQNGSISGNRRAAHRFYLVRPVYQRRLRNAVVISPPFPDVHIQTREINTREQIAPLNEGSLDLGLMRNTQLPDTLAWEVILREPLMAMIPHDHPLASRPAVAGRAGKEPFVFFDPQVGTGCMTISWG